MNHALRSRPDVLAAFRDYMRLEKRRTQGLSPQELQRWWSLRARLDATLGPLEVGSKSGERRATPRIPVALTVRFENRASMGPMMMTNLSRGGIFVPMDEPLPIGTVLELRIRVDDPPQEIVLAGEVVSQNVGPRMEANRRGMGIRFCCATRREQELIDALYNQQVERHLEASGR